MSKKYLLIILPLVLAACDNKTKPSNFSSSGEITSLSSIETKDIHLSIEPLDDEIEIHTDLQYSYCTSSYIDSLPAGIKGVKQEDKPAGQLLGFRVYGKDVNGETNYQINVSENQDLSDAFSYFTNEEEIELYNFKINTTYYYNVIATNNGETLTSKTYSLTTEDLTPRNLNVDGVKNCRDIGGYLLDSGEYSKQGLIYRTGRLNVSGTDDDFPKACQNVINDISEEGIRVMRNQLKIKTEIDVRKTRDNENGNAVSSPLGDDINFFAIPMEYDFDSSLNLITANKSSIKSFFEVLGDEDNYPLIYHCNIGTDRTGMLSVLLHCLLGVSEDDFHRDYLFSNFANIGNPRKYTSVTPYLTMLKNYDGSDLKEKTYNYLVNEVDVLSDDLDTFIKIMSE